MLTRLHRLRRGKSPDCKSLFQDDSTGKKRNEVKFTETQREEMLGKVIPPLSMEAEGKILPDGEGAAFLDFGLPVFEGFGQKGEDAESKRKVIKTKPEKTEEGASATAEESAGPTEEKSPVVAIPIIGIDGPTEESKGEATDSEPAHDAPAELPEAEASGEIPDTQTLPEECGAFGFDPRRHMMTVETVRQLRGIFEKKLTKPDSAEPKTFSEGEIEQGVLNKHVGSGLIFREVTLLPDLDRVKTKEVANGETITIGYEPGSDIFVSSEDFKDAQLSYSEGTVTLATAYSTRTFSVEVDVPRFEGFKGEDIVLEMKRPLGSDDLHVTPFKRETRVQAVTEELITLGNSNNCNVPLRDKSLQGQCAEILLQDGIPYLLPGESDDEVFLNGEIAPFNLWNMLLEGDIIGVGYTAINLMRSKTVVGDDIRGRKVTLSVSDPDGQMVIPIIELDFDKKDSLLIGRKVTGGGIFVSTDEGGRKVLNLPDRNVSRKHAIIKYGDNGTLAILDMSYNGTIVDNNARSNTDAPLQLFNGSWIQIGDYRLGIRTEFTEAAETSTDIASRIPSVIKSRAIKINDSERTCLERLTYMEEALKLLPDSANHYQALSLWEKWILNELEELSTIKPEKQPEGYEMIMEAMEHIVGKICSSSNPSSVLRLLENSPRMMEFAWISKAFKPDFKKEYKRVKVNRPLLRKIKNAVKDDDYLAGLLAVIDVIPGELIDKERTRELKSDFANSRISAADLTSTLNDILNPVGIAIWESDAADRIVLSTVVKIITTPEATAVVIKPVRGFENLFMNKYGGRWGGLCHVRSNTIMLANDEGKLDKSSHETYHLLDAISGYIKSVGVKYPNPDAAATFIEANAIAAEYYHSELSGEEILPKISLRSKTWGRHARANKVLFDWINGREGDVRALLLSYLDNQYHEILGVTYQDIFGNAMRSPRSIVASTINKRLDAIALGNAPFTEDLS